jgi:hypothetical protein
MVQVAVVYVRTDYEYRRIGIHMEQHPIYIYKEVERGIERSIEIFIGQRAFMEVEK